MKRKISVYVLLAALTLVFAAALLPAHAQAATLKSKTADVVKAAKVKKSDNDTVKLEKLYKYFTYKKGTKENFKYARKMTFSKDSKSKKWPNKYALDMFTKKAGMCYDYAAAYGFAAMKATGLTARVAVGKTIGYDKDNAQVHAWTEIKIGKKWYVYDTIMEKYSKLVTKHPTYCGKLKSKVKKVYCNYKGVKYYTLKF